MKKTIFIIIVIFSIHSCNDIKIPIGKIDDTHTKKQNFFTISWNGYEKKDVIETGCLIGGDYHKVVFKDSANNYYATKYAYQVNFHHISIGKQVMYFSCLYNTSLHNIYKASEQFVSPPGRKNYVWIPGGASIPYFYMDVVAGVLSKAEYENWMKNHPETIMLKA